MHLRVSHVQILSANYCTALRYLNNYGMEKLNTILYVSLELIRKISIMLYPIIPNSSLKALKIFNILEDNIDFNSIKNHENLKKKDKLNKIPILFKKIKND